MIYHYNKSDFTSEQISGFSGSPVVHYNPSIEEFVPFGMCINAGNGMLRIVRLKQIEQIIDTFERKKLNSYEGV